MPMILVLMTVLEISLAMAIGFLVGRMYQIRRDELEQRRESFTLPPTASIPRP
jgi:hypothetical protein